ncbi:MAG: family 20 glycosylhydrolase [Phocaeicola vulgatus]
MEVITRKEQIREVVAYAAEHHVTIVPEIDIPGHMLAALTAYPSLGCIKRLSSRFLLEFIAMCCVRNAACYTF